MRTDRLTSNSVRSAALVATLASFVVSGCARDDNAPRTDPVERLRVVLDYSPTLSDAGALLYLASNPAVDLLAVTLPGTGEADCEPGTRTTRSLLVLAGRPDVAVGCGREAPLEGSRDWPKEWRTEVNRWGDELLPAVKAEPVLDAEQLMVDTLGGSSSPITLVAVGPLTNVGAVLSAHPELAERVQRIVIMGGAVGVPGNVSDSPAAEWNIYIDPEAARRVIGAGISVTFVPLDATNDLPWTERLLRRLAALDAPAARTVHEMAASRQSLVGFYLWDELAAMAAVEPKLVSIESIKVRIDDDGALVRDSEGAAVDVAVSADAGAATTEFLRMLNGGVLPTVAPLSRAAVGYLIAMNGADSRAGAALDRAFAAIRTARGDPRTVTNEFVKAFIDAVAALATDLRAIDPPPELIEAHANYLGVLDEFVAGKDELVAALAAAEGTDPNELLADATSHLTTQDFFDRMRDACQVLEDYSFLHGGPRPCSSSAEQ